MRLAEGCPVVFPTDTVLGIGVSVRDADDLSELYDIKGRDEEKPIAWLVSSKESLVHHGKEVPPYAKALASEFWPGPLTLIVRANDNASQAFLPESRTIGLRMSASWIARELAERVGSPIATTSANISGQPAPASMAELDPRIAERAYVLDERELEGQPEPTADDETSGVPSTIIDCTGELPCIIRAGGITLSDIDRLLGEGSKRW